MERLFFSQRINVRLVESNTTICRLKVSFLLVAYAFTSNPRVYCFTKGW